MTISFFIQDEEGSESSSSKHLNNVVAIMELIQDALVKKAEYQWKLIDYDDDYSEEVDQENIRKMIKEMDSVIEKQEIEYKKYKSLYKKTILKVMLF
jgi:sulfur relay (sulfurtransferase) DsrC/TusE family protein